jgi:hypothetical protein
MRGASTNSFEQPPDDTPIGPEGSRAVQEARSGSDLDSPVVVLDARGARHIARAFRLAACARGAFTTRPTGDSGLVHLRNHG